MENFANKILKRLAVVLVALCAMLMTSHEAQAQQVAIKSNALSWLLSTPNVGYEIVTGEHSSVEVSAMGHWRPFNMNSKIFVLQPEYRYWFNGRPMTREYVGFTSMVAAYDIMAQGFVYKGNAVMLGLTGGYVFALTDHWNFEVAGGFGVLGFKQKQYYQHDNYDDYFVDEAVKANSIGYKLFPSKLSVSFSYIIK